METKDETKQEVNTPVGQPLSKMDEARQLLENQNKAIAEMKAENDRREQLKADELLSGSAGGQVQAEVAKEETPEEYAKRILKNNV